MCQLNLIHIEHERYEAFNRIILASQLITNSRKMNKDGYGIYSGGKLFKFHLSPELTSNLGEIVQDYVLDKTVLSHVRQATFTNGKKEIKVDNTHPFETKDFILAHNGTLSSEDINLMKEKRFDEMIDSRIFLEILQETYNKSKEKDIANLLNTVMKLFKGKFAFLIYCKFNKKYYIARGITADLNYSNIYITNRNDHKEGAKIGFIINTDRNDLIDAFKLAETVIYIVTGCYLYIDIPILLEKESIFEASGIDLIRIGDLKERYSSVDQDNFGYRQSSIIPLTNHPFLLTFMDDYGLSLIELDELLFNFSGLSIVDISKKEELQVKNVLEPVIKKFYNAQKAVLWRKIRGKYSLTSDPYSKNNLQFPYMLNTIQQLEKVWVGLKND